MAAAEATTLSSSDQLLEDKDEVKDQTDVNMNGQNVAMDGEGGGGGGGGDKLNASEEQSLQLVADAEQGSGDFRKDEDSGSASKEQSGGQERVSPEVEVAIPADDAIRITVEDDGDVQNDKMSSKVTTVSFASEVEILNEDEFIDDMADQDGEENGAEEDDEAPPENVTQTDVGADPSGGAHIETDGVADESVPENEEEVVQAVAEAEAEGIETEDSSGAVGDAPQIHVEEHQQPGESRKEGDDAENNLAAVTDEQSPGETSSGPESAGTGSQGLPEISVNAPELEVQEAPQSPDIKSNSDMDEDNIGNDEITQPVEPESQSTKLDDRKEETFETEQDMIEPEREEAQEDQDEIDETYEELPVAQLHEEEQQSPQVVQMEPLRRMQAAAPVYEVAVLERVEIQQMAELTQEVLLAEATTVDEVSDDTEQKKNDNQEAPDKLDELDPVVQTLEAEEIQSLPVTLELEPVRMDACALSDTQHVELIETVELLPEEKTEENLEIDAVLAAQAETVQVLAEESNQNQIGDDVIGENEHTEENERPEQRVEEDGDQKGEVDKVLAESQVVPPADTDEGVLSSEEVQENTEVEEVPHDQEQMLPTTSDEDNYSRMAGDMEPLPLMEPLPPIEPRQELGMGGPSPIAIYTQVNAAQSMGLPSPVKLRDQMLPDIAQYPQESHHQHQYSRSARFNQDSTSRATSISRVQIARIPSPPPHVKAQLLADDERRASTRMSGRLPPSVMKMSSVMVSARKKAEKNRQASVYYEERKFQKTISLDEAINSRPPMPFDLDGPGPWSYSPRNKPLYEDNSPEWTFGSKFPERGGGGRTAYAKSWFNSSNNFTNKTRFERRWPSPNAYSPRKSLIGRRVPGKPEYPSFSIGVKTKFSIAKHGAEHEPGPDRYQRQNSDPVIFRRAPAFSMAARLDRGRLFGAPEITPAPNVYNPHIVHTSRKTTYPAYTICGVRKPKSHALGPHATL